MKSLIVYFSHTGENSVGGKLEIVEKGFTEIVAEKIAKYVNGDIFKLEPEEEYPTNYEECVKRARKESMNNEIVPFKNALPDLNKYDVIYVGFPNWYRSYPRIVATFFSVYSFEGKVVKPFCTNEEGAFGIGELEMRKAVKGAIIKNGFACRGHDADKCDEELKKWLGL